jgi:hypothetical protein
MKPDSQGNDSPSTETAESAFTGWVQATPEAAWQPRDSCGEVAYNGHLWLMGGWFDSYSAPPRDVWRSSDGVQWELVTREAPWLHSDLPTTLVFQDRMWLMGGWYNGRLPDASASNQVWASANGAEWEQVTGAAGWSPRLGAAGVVFRGKMWLLGGVEKYYHGTDADLRNDVWCSEDGREWRQVTAEAPWSPRAYHGLLAFDDKLWVFGGGNYLPEYYAQNDVWCSSDGVRWTCVTETAPWSPRMWFSAVVYRQRMWVLGGWSNHPSRNWNDVWHTQDGAQWERLETESIWSPRHEHSTYVLQNRLWVAGGMVPPLTNDVWSLELPHNLPNK